MIVMIYLRLFAVRQILKRIGSHLPIVMVEPQLKGQPMSQSTVTSHEYMPFPYATLEASVHHIGTGAERHRRVPLLIIHVEFSHTR